MDSSTTLLQPIDYIVIFLMLMVSSGFSIYFGLKSNMLTPNGYFLADRKMSLIPIVLSTFATSVSGGTLIGLPTEAYYFGGVLFCYSLILFFPLLIINQFFIPIYHKMGSVNIFMFLEIRFSPVLKKLASLLVMSRSIFIGGNIIYATSLVLSQASNVDLVIVIRVVTGICILYTTIGGMKGVMWADVIQGVVMLSSILAMIIVGFVHVGGVSVVWQRNLETGRMNFFEFDVDPTIRHTFWTSTIGCFVSNLSLFASSQTVIQRLLTAPTVKDAQRGMLLSILILSLANFLCVLLGVLIFAEFYNCDPLKAKSISNRNQLVSLFVMDVLGRYPMLPGIFFAGLLSAALSTLSSIMNSAAAVAVETFIMPFSKLSVNQMAVSCKLVSIAIGLLILLSVLLAARFSSASEAVVSFSATVDGAVLVLLLIGIIMPQANLKAVIIAFISGVSVCSWIVMGNLINRAPMVTKPLSVEGCKIQNFTSITLLSKSWLNSTVSTDISVQNFTDIHHVSSLSKYFPLSNVAYMWISTIGAITCFVTFVFMMQIFGKDETFSAHLEIIPEVVKNFHKRLPKFWRRILLCDVYDNDGTIYTRSPENQEMIIQN